LNTGKSGNDVKGFVRIYTTVLNQVNGYDGTVLDIQAVMRK
jgi:hypothetical protein